MKPNAGRGDKGDTDLFGGKRIAKDDLRLEAIGSIDELNSFIGLVRAEMDNKLSYTDGILEKIQNKLFRLGADLASPETSKVRISADDVKFVEDRINEVEEGLKSLKKFILPTGNKPATLLHVSRTVCRRSERIIVSLSKIESINPNAISFVNRLSDLLFALSRSVNKHSGIFEQEWKS